MNALNTPTLKKWWISIRPFAMPASTMPVIFGTVLAALYGNYPFRPGVFVLALLGMVILHSAANILSDITDYRKGLDTVPTPVSGGIVRGILSPMEAKRVSILLFVTGTIIGLILTWLSGYFLLVIGITGLIIGIFYTLGDKIALKYHAFGDFAVFMNFGILGSLGAWYVQSSTFSWIPALWAVPMALLVIAILHANNWRDIASDNQGKIFTVASLLGDKGSLRYYAFLIFGPFIIIYGFIFIPRLISPNIPAMPLPFIIVIFALPLAIILWRKALSRFHPKKPMDFITLDGATATLNLAFGILCTLSLFIYAFIN
ncbi:MAG: 1,4-dihydroxy-2-naphthoate octaprenyltransferase [Bacteroidetes bacterium]|nr:1,4-dihydroxy-2-naphthoate octaprenyltransferase [Bacteroidota bacterium]